MCHYWRSILDWGPCNEYERKCGIQMHIPKQRRLEPETPNIQQNPQTHLSNLALNSPLNLPQIKQHYPKT